MGLFSASSPLDQHVEAATSEKHTTDDWAKIVDICDKINEGSNGVTDGIKAITKRLKNENPRVQLQTITLLDACISNCGREFLLKVSEREFEQELHKILTSSKTHHKVTEKLRECLKKWAEGDFRGDPQLGLIPALYMKLQQLGHSFDVPSDSPKQTPKFSSDPNVVQSQQEEDDIAKAIQLSLQESGSNSFKTNTNQNTTRGVGGLYPSASAALSAEFSSGAASAVTEKEQMKVRALYDFEAAEDNELTFKAGEIIVVSNHNDANWWEGSNHRGKGLFPSNFVTDNLYEEETKQEIGSGKKVSFSESVEVTELREDFPPSVEPTGEIDEEKINHLLHILHEADPTAARADDPLLPQLEDQVNAMAPTIDVELEKIDRVHAELARISTDLVGGLSLYHQLMRDMPPSMPYYAPYNAMQPGMPGSNVPDVKPPHYMQPMGMPQMYPQPGQLPPYMAMPTADTSYIQNMPPHSQPDMTPQSIPSTDYPHGQPLSSYVGQPGPVNFAPYPYGATANATFEPQQPIYAHPPSANMPHVSNMGPYQPPMPNMIDAAGSAISSQPPSMISQLPPAMHLHHPGQGNLHITQGIPVQPVPSQMQPIPYPNILPTIQSPLPPSMPPHTSVSYQPPVMQQPLL